MSSIDFLQLANAAKAAAIECIASCRQHQRSGHYTHRAVEILAIDEHGERIGDQLDFIDVKELSGKRLRAIVTDHAPAQYDHITVQGGVDAYDSFKDAMQYPDDYEPMIDNWDVSTKDPEAATVTSAEREPLSRRPNPNGVTQRLLAGDTRRQNDANTRSHDNSTTGRSLQVPANTTR